MANHSRDALREWERLQALLHGNDAVLLDGKSLDIAGVIAVTKYGVTPALDEETGTIDRINASVDILREHLKKGDLVYGVNTGFGGSADVRTTSLENLQKALIQHQNSGILASSDISGSALPAADTDSLSMPTSWSRGTILIRVNSLVRGHSAVSLQIIRILIKLLECGVTPVIPLRGSISASGDLIPLSYVASVIKGNPSTYVRLSQKHGYRVVPSPVGLEVAGISPVTLGPKEGLGLLNGTATSASVASLVLFETNNLAVLSQVITALNVEALQGTAESFHPFIASVRPHPGQVEAASNILSFLEGSRLAMGVLTSKSMIVSGLAQDRYALRTASQWIGPLLEDLALATNQVRVELNATTDNPLLDATDGVVHHGGNFQGLHVTMAMEKARLCLATLGKLLFAQTTELINPAMNRGLPPNLAPDDPSTSFVAKGIDIAAAAYYSELAFLANPVVTHAQSAEMHNQAVNSLALVAGRYAEKAVEILSGLAASSLWAGLQGVDLRVCQVRFMDALHDKAHTLFRRALSDDLSKSLDSAADPAVFSDSVYSSLWFSLAGSWNETTKLDLEPRCSSVAEIMTGTLLSTVLSDQTNPQPTIAGLATFRTELKSLLHETHSATMGEMEDDHEKITPQYLSHNGRVIYHFVRGSLGIKFHLGRKDDPLNDIAAGASAKLTIGGQVGVINQAIRDGRVSGVVMEILKEMA
ncbi:phenylalanine ammonia-lyase [Eremomyces bilateralis CBS 781.70]|uniref:Phenylalanine ammonia-lyase n=1 Tax=Eremomyces bilateralis CBS 781.70 TaxID=1392243 RepID=A0A6G1GBP1_9PEZI|nr:phenylalanine ammonia-lyase [Eremomyces bilateralis CBS 781.70]KAF1815434.1 phenylalanine ammonia-lyase [Eremomyces bilateralis CBS 781.70]